MPTVIFHPISGAIMPISVADVVPNRIARDIIDRPLQLSIAFESLCPDSQQLIVDRLYPNVLNRSNDHRRNGYSSAAMGIGNTRCAKRRSLSSW